MLQRVLQVLVILITGLRCSCVFAQAGAFQPGDVNCDSVLTSADIIYLVNYVFKSGPPPCGQQVLSSYQPLSDNPRQSFKIPEASATATPGRWDTLYLDQVQVCDLTSPVHVDLYLSNHDPLYTLIIPMMIESVSGPGFVRYDSCQWIDRIPDPSVQKVMDIESCGPMYNFDSARSAVDGVSPDWVEITLIDALDQGLPPLDSGAGYLCRLFFTPIGGPSVVRMQLNTWGVYPEVGFVEFEYGAHEFALEANEGSITILDSSRTGDLDCSGTVNSADIIRLVNIVFKGGEP